MRGGRCLRWVLRQVVERPCAGGGACAASAWAMHCWTIDVMSVAGGAIVGSVTMFGKDAVLEIVGGLGIPCWRRLTRREIWSSLVCVEARSAASSA